jgi:drug/metabolite transporter (DMT)-like permease
MSPSSLGFGLLSALLYGAADLTGGVASRRTPALTVIVGAYAVSLPLVIIAALAEGGPPLTSAQIGLAILGGIFEVIATLALYVALAAGMMSQVSPFVGVLGASLPLAVGLTLGEPLPAGKVVGIALALVAIVTVARPARQGAGSRRALAFAAVSGVGYAGSFMLFSIAQASAGGDGAWHMALVTRVVGLAIAGSWALLSGRPLAATRAARPMIGLAGLFDATATVCLLAAYGSGPLGLVSVLASLYPAVTVVLAAALLKERLGRIEAVGVACALCAVALMGGA